MDMLKYSAENSGMFMASLMYLSMRSTLSVNLIVFVISFIALISFFLKTAVCGMYGVRSSLISDGWRGPPFSIIMLKRASFSRFSTGKSTNLFDTIDLCISLYIDVMRS